MPTIRHLRYDAPDYAEHLGPLRDLVFRVWPPSEPQKVNLDLITKIDYWRRSNHFILFHLNEEFGKDEPLAVATLFVREIITSRGVLPVGALASVCSHPDYRGRGYGRDVVNAAFAYLPQLPAEVSLFQTPIPDFYSRLGARLVDNRFYNGSDSTDPFRDVYKMIYPAAFNWPEGDIDLNGSGY